MFSPSASEITQEKNPTEVEVEREFADMWDKARRSLRDAMRAGGAERPDQLPDKCLDEIHDRIHRDHRAICATYPIVLKIMVYQGQYHPKAIRRFLAHVKHHPWRSEEEYLETQATYVAMLYRCTHDRAAPAAIKAVREEAMRLLRDDKVDFEKKVDWATKVVDEQGTEIAREQRAELAARIGRLAAREESGEAEALGVALSGRIVIDSSGI